MPSTHNDSIVRSCASVHHASFRYRATTALTRRSREGKRLGSLGNSGLSEPAARNARTFPRLKTAVSTRRPSWSAIGSGGRWLRRKAQGSANFGVFCILCLVVAYVGILKPSGSKRPSLARESGAALPPTMIKAGSVLWRACFKGFGLFDHNETEQNTYP